MLTRKGLIVGLLCATPFALAAQARAGKAVGASVECAKCHANRDFLVGKGAKPGEDSLLFVPPTVLAGTAHDTLRCTSCHRGFEEGYPHRTGGPMVTPCQTCHDPEGKDWAASVHAFNAETKGDAPTCVRCHGSHVIYPIKDPRSPTYRLNVAAKCGSCHGDARIIGTYFATPAKEQARIAAAQYPKSVHGVAMTRDGLVVSATCSDCHRAHKILPADSLGSSVHRSHIPETCGSCHAGLVRTFEASAHSPAYLGVGHDTLQRPVCVDCHSAHGIVRTDRPGWLAGVVGECGKCHQQLYETYFDTYHGKVTRLGFDVAAKCSDCHTAHNMRPPTDPQSSVSPVNLVATCGRCHAGTNANFIKYYPHGDPRQRLKYPKLYWPWLLMTTLLVSVMSFFGLHTALWVTRIVIDHRRGGVESKGGQP